MKNTRTVPSVKGLIQAMLVEPDSDIANASGFMMTTVVTSPAQSQRNASRAGKGRLVTKSNPIAAKHAAMNSSDV